MLVLTRKTAQKIRIGHEITVTILRIQGRRVKLGVEAPRGVEIVRSELVETGASRHQPAEEVRLELNCGLQ